MLREQSSIFEASHRSLVTYFECTRKARCIKCVAAPCQLEATVGRATSLVGEMRIACLQFSPQVGDIDNNLNRADAVLNKARPEELEALDLLVLPEMSFSGTYAAVWKFSLMSRVATSTLGNLGRFKHGFCVGHMD